MDLTEKQIVKELMIKYGFTAPDMTVTEFVEDILPSEQTKSYLDSIVSEIKKTISEMKENGKYHYENNRKVAIDALKQQVETMSEWSDRYEEQRKGVLTAVNIVEDLPSAQPETKPIDYQDCSNAMLKMWMDNVVTDGEYNRIMDKLNAHWAESREE